MHLHSEERGHQHSSIERCNKIAENEDDILISTELGIKFPFSSRQSAVNVAPSVAKFWQVAEKLRPATLRKRLALEMCLVFFFFFYFGIGFRELRGEGEKHTV